MLHVSTKNSVKKRQKCKYTFSDGQDWLKSLAHYFCTVKCTYGVYSIVKGQENALVEQSIDDKDVHSIFCICVQRIFNAYIQELISTRVFVDPKAHLGIKDIYKLSSSFSFSPKEKLITPLANTNESVAMKKRKKIFFDEFIKKFCD